MGSGHDQGAIRNDLSGTAGAVVQAGTVQGGVHISVATDEGWTAPRQLPLDVTGFVNRRRDIAELDSLLSHCAQQSPVFLPSPIVISAIAGAAGVGKTALAVHWAHRVREAFPDGDLYVNLRGYDLGPPLTAAQALDGFLHCLNVPAARIPSELGARSALFRSLLDGRRVLLVLDNAAAADQVRPLLPGSHRCLVLVTSRSRLSGLVAREGATRMVLQYLSPEGSLQLLREIIGRVRVDAELAAAAQLAERCDHLPLALRIVAERAMGHPHSSLRDLVGELADERDRLDALATDDDEVTAVRTVFSWSYRALPEAVAQTFRLLALHPAPEFSTRAVAALSGISAVQARRRLDRLHGLHLIEQTSRDRYRFHDLLRSYALEQAMAEESDILRGDAVDRTLNWYLHTACAAARVILPQGRAVPLPDQTPQPDPETFADLDAALAWCEQERLVLLDAVRQADALGRYEIAWKLPVALMGFFERRSYWDDWISTHRVGLAAARNLGDRFGEGWTALSLGDAYWDLRDFGSAQEAYAQALEVTRDTGDRWGEAFALRGISLVHLEQGSFERAIDYSERALPALVDLGERRGQGMCLLSIGQGQHGLGHPDQAVAQYLSALEIFRELDNRWSETLGTFRLALALQDLGRHHEAISAFEDAAASFAGLGDRRHEALVLDCLGQAHSTASDYAAARQAWQRALALLTELDDPQASTVRSRLGDLPQPPL
ncbi:ATP-binding protein [Wenjunlia tyrosinilytica]|uniref:NB-ARC domain-containing protein n=1 Tax=Wenjunlia tyrosinilytica TaxID=1544741 RepID=A0A918DVK3_9ACTN|nr:tetratricopeptide repeat protein [Wenjunlia tyrosinilytica]GGO85249.1 hypothetical protein GCM10012280_18600 [Wenjunlia tyrosinilytica]